MKHYYLKSIVQQIKKQAKENLIVSLLMILSISLLTISFIISNSDQLERAMIQNTDFQIQLVNDNIFSTHDLDDIETNRFLSSGKDYLLHFIDQLDNLSKQESVTNYNFNLICSNALETTENTYLVKYLIGVNTTSFLSNENLTIISGRMFSQDELDQGQYKIIIPDYITTYDVGDKVTLYKPISDVEDDQKLQKDQVTGTIEVEIIGKYKADLSLRVSNDQYDMFDNYSYILMPNNTLKELVTNYFDNIRQVYLNHISFIFDNYESYSNFYNSYKEVLININSTINSFSNIDTKLHNKQQNYEYILYSIQRIKLFYNIVFVITSIVALLLLCWLIYYLLSSKIKEINLFYSLGESKIKIIIRYSIMYSLILVVALVIGISLGYFISNFLQQRIISNSTSIQYELLSYSDINQSTITSTSTLVKLSLSSLLQVIVKVVTISLFTTIFTTAAILLPILKGNIRDKLQKGE